MRRKEGFTKAEARGRLRQAIARTSASEGRAERLKLALRHVLDETLLPEGWTRRQPDGTLVYVASSDVHTLEEAVDFVAAAPLAE